MNDKDYLLEMLTTEKNISVNLVYALNEASNKNIYDLYFKMFKSINKMTKDIYEVCLNKGYYQKNTIAEKKIIDSYNQLFKELN
jgi:spore coat protein CotF